MDVFKDETLMGVILTHHKGNMESRAEALNWLPLLVLFEYSDSLQLDYDMKWIRAMYDGEMDMSPIRI